MRLTLFPLLFWASAALFAQNPSAPRVALPETKETADLTSELRAVWPGIATATNTWAEAIRHRDGWADVLHATFTETVAEAEKGVAVAELKLGYLYFVGDGVEADYAAASRWLSKAAGAHLAPAQFLLGIAYLNGLGVVANFETAVDHLSDAAEQGFAKAQFQLGLCFLRGGPGVNQAPARGFKWVLRAAEQGEADAQQFVAWCYSSGTGVNEDPLQALAWCRKAAEQNSATAQDFLGLFCATGYGTTQDWSEAVKWFRRASDQGLGTAQMHLAQCYERGQGVSQDAAQAWHWWREAAWQGYPSAQFHLGLCSFQGFGILRDFSVAVEWFQKAATRQHIGGQLYLGLCFWKGQGISVDAEEAQKWWREAAIHGITRRVAELGDSQADVEKWWQQVAEQGNPRIQCALAEFYRFGHGVPQNDGEALKWYKKASGSGDPAALQAAAWLLATSPKAELRDGRAAVDLARKAVAAKQHKDSQTLDTLAAAYAEAGQFAKAISSEKEAIAVTQDDDDKKEYQSRLKLYQARTAFRALQNGLPAPQLE